MAANYDDELEQFRRQWQIELGSQIEQRLHDDEPLHHSGDVHHTQPVITIGIGTAIDECDKLQNAEEKATGMFLQGVQYEESGEVVTAIKFYKNAMKLVPDIEQRIYKAQKKVALKSSASVESSSLETNLQPTNFEETLNEHFRSSSDAKPSKGLEILAHEEEEATKSKLPCGNNLLRKFQCLLQREGGRICIPKDKPKGVHFSALPREVVIYLLKWIVSSELDLISLEQVALVCRGLYVCSREPELWKLVCFKIWNEGSNPPHLKMDHKLWNNWREMYIRRPRLNFNGCYISKSTYVRPGENSFQDTNCHPWHMVSYFRYLRFFADRSALLLTTADVPSSVVGHLKRCNGRYSSAVLQGTYSIVKDDIVTATFKRRALQPTSNPQRRKKRDAEVMGNSITEQVYRLELEIRSVKNRQNCALYWIGYSVETFYQQSEPSITRFDVNLTRFPALWFSRVKSYNVVSFHPLA